tara:strand:+ start:561 stop:740 length:180 start_codon:yes stop_codon:yes gene_type:complete
MTNRNNVETIKTLLGYLDDSPMVCEVMSITDGVAVIKFNLDQEYTYYPTQKGIDALEKK